ncbi:MAG TPA: Mut7-C RNAse domain-containing protein, partial [Thermoplasmata archaeon]|nr:Mut7-C RNAse domain-containing protein [Thermoplasmata archaeon]
LTSPRLADQLRAAWSAMPAIPTELRFERCTLCNGTLARVTGTPSIDLPAGVPRDRVAAGLPLYRCEECAHIYWEGSHTAEVRRRLNEWSGRTPT